MSPVELEVGQTTTNRIVYYVETTLSHFHCPPTTLSKLIVDFLLWDKTTISSVGAYLFRQPAEKQVPVDHATKKKTVTKTNTSCLAPILLHAHSC